MTDTPVVLVVDDRPENLITVEAVLQPLDVMIRKALRAEDALHFLLENDAAVILLDVEMPGIDGFETARLIRQRPRSHSTPIIFITAGDRGHTGVLEGYKLGAVDYLIKPFHPEHLRWKVSVLAELHRSQQRERLFIWEQTRRAEAEANAHRVRLLGEVGKLLASDIRRGSVGGIAQPFIPEFAECAAIYSSEHNKKLPLVSIATCEEEPDDTSQKIVIAYKLGDPLFKTIRDSTPTCVEDFAEDDYTGLDSSHRDLITRHNLRSALFIPIRGHAGIRAILALYRRRVRGFTSSDQSFANELTERIALGVTNVELYQESESANRAKNEFLAIVSHELRTPLVSIVGWANILLSKELSPDARNKALQTILRNANIQTDLINEILDFSKIAAATFSITFDTVDAAIILKETVESFRPLADTKTIRLVTQIVEEAALVIGDHNRLHQLFSNLLSNAIKFTPEKGSVHVALTLTGPLVEIQIADTGIGIEAEFLPRVFEPFVQADSSNTRSYPGLGLGLAIARRLVDLHHGGIRVESPGRGKGSRFTITFPAVVAESRAS